MVVVIVVIVVVVVVIDSSGGVVVKLTDVVEYASVSSMSSHKMAVIPDSD